MNSVREFNKFKKRISLIKQTFPNDSFPISLELIVFICEQNFLGKEVTVNSLFTSVNFSYTAIRHHYLYLLNNGFIEKKESENDKRVKLVAPSPKSIQFMNDLSYLDTICNQKLL